MRRNRHGKWPSTQVVDRRIAEHADIVRRGLERDEVEFALAVRCARGLGAPWRDYDEIRRECVQEQIDEEMRLYGRPLLASSFRPPEHLGGPPHCFMFGGTRASEAITHRRTRGRAGPSLGG